jgi:hypothetical protein
VNPDVNTEAFAFRCGVADQFPPRIGESKKSVARRILDVPSPWCADIRHAKNRRCSDSSLLECFEVAGDTLSAYITTHPMPPNSWLGIIGRMKKKTFWIVTGFEMCRK